MAGKGGPGGAADWLGGLHLPLRREVERAVAGLEAAGIGPGVVGAERHLRAVGAAARAAKSVALMVSAPQEDPDPREDESDPEDRDDDPAELARLDALLDARLADVRAVVAEKRLEGWSLVREGEAGVSGGPDEGP